MTIRARMRNTVILMSAGTVLVAGIGLVCFSLLGSAHRRVSSVQAVVIEMLQARRAEHDYLRHGDQACADTLNMAVRRGLVALEQLRSSVAGTSCDSLRVELLAYQAGFNRTVAAADSRGPAGASSPLDSLDGAPADSASTPDPGLVEAEDLTETDRAESRVELLAGEMRNTILRHTTALSHTLRLVFLLVAGGGIAAALAFGRRLATAVSAPVTALTAAMESLAGGASECEVPFQERQDELGLMARAVEVFKRKGLEMRRLEADQQERLERESGERRRLRLKLAEDFEASVGRVVGTVSTAAEELQVTAQAMSALSEETSSQAGTVATAAEQSSANLDAVAVASDQLSGSILEINRQILLSSEIASRAVDKGRRADQSVEKLTQSVARIGEVVSLIKSVANQTNLLALNATIEAARAGQAGKGFAVVADEVKTLAGQTTRATEEIRGQIQAIEHDTRAAVQGIREIAQVVRENDEIVTTIVGAMEEQGVTTQQIARNVEQAATGTREVSRNVNSLNTASGETGAAADQVLGAARELSQSAGQLAREVQAFLQNVREG